MLGCADTVRDWGTSPAERARPFPCDEVLPDATDTYFRAVTVDASAAVVFRWLCQLRAAPYSYDWIDNFGRTSPQTLTPGLEDLAIGQRFMQVFDLVLFERDRHVTLRVRDGRAFPPLVVTYLIAPVSEDRCRLLAKLALRTGPGLRDRLVDWLLPAGDWIMMRRQLLNLKGLAEATMRTLASDSR